MACYENLAYIYDKLIDTDIDYKKWAKNILEVCHKMKVNMDDYLDLACGTGNMTFNIAEYFKSTWAVDISSDMLTEAEEKSRMENKKVRFICQNICELNLNHKFDLITCSLDSINYILDIDSVKNFFEKVYTHLKDGGIFIFDINSYYKLTNILGNNIYHYDDEDIVYIWENNIENEIVDMYLTFFIKEKNLYRRFDEEHIERAYSEEDIEDLLSKSGFSLIKKNDNYEDKQVDCKTERIAYVVKKI